MTVVRSIVGGIELQPQASTEKLSPTVTSFVLEGIAQNTSGSVFEPEVMSHVSTTRHLLPLRLDYIDDPMKYGPITFVNLNFLVNFAAFYLAFQVVLEFPLIF
jgi:hypothetical protein